MLTQSEVKKLHNHLVTAKQPLFFFHDDPDGLASYLLCYRYIKEGIGFPIKARPCITQSYSARVDEVRPDRIFILDVALVEQEFIDAVKVPITWVDHHTLQDMDGVTYMNPRAQGVNIPTPVLIWQALYDKRPQDLWLAVAGAIGDWYFPEFASTFQEACPDILPKDCSTVQEALFKTRLGTLVKVFSFNLKGPTREVKKSLKYFSQIEDPYEILDKKTKGGEFLWERYEKVNKSYEALKKQAVKAKTKDRLFVHLYGHDNLSVTKELSNELLYLFDDKVIILGRERMGEMRCSLRSPPSINLKAAFDKALVGVQGYGGGHEQALGCAIKKDSWDLFLDNLRSELGF